jgi:hypothetical protein
MIAGFSAFYFTGSTTYTLKFHLRALVPPTVRIVLLAGT